MRFCSQKSWSREGRHLTSILKHTVHFRPYRLGTELMKCDKSYGGKVLSIEHKFVLWLQLPYSWYYALQPRGLLGTCLQCLETRSWEEHKKLTFKIPRSSENLFLEMACSYLTWKLSQCFKWEFCVLLFSVKVGSCLAKTEVHHDATRNDYVSCKLIYIYISHKDYIFFTVKHDSQVTLYRSDAAFASSVLLLSGQSSYSGQWRFGVHPWPANALSQARKVS